MKNTLLIFILSFGLNIAFSQTTIYMTKENGIYIVPCRVNGLKLRFIFDTGASDVSISLTEAIFMVKNNYLSVDDIYGTTYARLADGDITKNTEILLKEVEIGGLKLYNIRASVIHNLAAPLLLGQSAIEKLGAIQLDGYKLIILNKGNKTYYDYSSDNKVNKNFIKAKLTCDHLKNVTITFNKLAGTCLLNMDGKVVELKDDSMASGIKYSNAEYVYSEWHGNSKISHNDKVICNCK